MEEIETWIRLGQKEFMIELILYYFEPFKKSLELKVGDKYKMLTKILYLGFRTLGG